LNLTDNMNDICKFVEKVGPTHGGDAPECYELVLREVQSLSWTAEYNHAVVLIGDDLPHAKHETPAKIDWKEVRQLPSALVFPLFFLLFDVYL